MKRIITSIRRANKDVLRAISEEYPTGVEDCNLIIFPTATGVNIRALEIELENTIYLVKMDDESYYQQFISKDTEEEGGEEGLEIEMGTDSNLLSGDNEEA